MADIIVKGAREHNLCDVDLILPRNKLICFTGVSGSGKSSLAFDTLYAEGQRRYIESLSSYARQFLGQLPKPDVDHITGLSPSISISQKSGGQNSRSTVGTITEIYDFLRVLFARVATGYCPKCGKAITAQTRSQIVDQIAHISETICASGDRLIFLAPLIRGQKGEFKDLFSDLLRQGYNRARVDNRLVRLDENLKLDRQMRHDIEVVIDRLTETADHTRLSESTERALAVGNGHLAILIESDDLANSNDTKTPNRPAKRGTKKIADNVSKNKSSETNSVTKNVPIQFSAHYACSECGINFDPPSPQLFSFNTPRGMCPTCEGLGEIHSFDPDLLIPDMTKSFQQGCIVPIGKWRDLGRWKRHIFHGVAEFLEREYGLPPHTVLETAWEELDANIQHGILWGTGHSHITFTWKNGPNGHKWGGPYEGIIPKMLQQYRETKSKMQRLAMEKYMRVLPCGVCRGDRLNEQARSFKIETASSNFSETKCSLPELCNLSIVRLKEFFSELKLSESGHKISALALKEIRSRIGFLINVGLDYLTLGRTAPTLSGGEMQRIRLASQIGSGLVGVLYILDEPSIGLHPRDNDRLLGTLSRLRDLGNTVIVVEHDEDTMRAADMIVDFGPGPGVHGGKIVTNTKDSQTLKYLTGEESITIPKERRFIDPKRKLVIRGAKHNNLKNIDVSIPLGAFVCVTGVSGSGKSSLINDILVEALNRDLNRGFGNPGLHKRIDGIDFLDKMIDIDQSPIGRGGHSNPATYIKVFDEIRNLFAELAESRAKGYLPGRFSFNVKGGRCDACEGRGTQKLEMDFLADMFITCPVCQGHRFNHETLSVRYKGKSIDQILNMSVEEARDHFENIPKINHYLTMLQRVGLGYMKLGQPSPTLSGGEAQRIKLARELVKRSTGKTLYLLDEPTTGLHFADIKMLLGVLQKFVDAGNTVLVVEHNLDVIKTADWIIDLGPEGGEAGGELIVAGTPEDVIKNKKSHTGVALKKHLERVLAVIDTKTKKTNHKTSKTSPILENIVVTGAEEHNLNKVSVSIPRDQMIICCGPSGSGKSSFAIDTIYAEGQRRYVESLSSYARQFIGQLQKPKVENIEGLSPAIAIEQKAASHSPRSTVGTATEIQDYLRVLFARLGVPHCPECAIPIGTQTLDEIISKITSMQNVNRILVTAPLQIDVGQQYEQVWQRLQQEGFVRIRIDGITYSLESPPEIDRRRKHDVELVVDRLILRDDQTSRMRIADSVETALAIGAGIVHVIEVDDSVPETKWKRVRYNQHLSCEKCGRSFERLTPHHFSANSPLGWCPHCEGLGVQQGANPTLFLHDPKQTLLRGAVNLFPNVNSQLGKRMIEVFASQNGIPIDLPFDQLDARHRRILFHGTGDTWYSVINNQSKPATNSSAKTETKSAKVEDKTDVSHSSLSFQFQYKGIYPTVEEATRLVPSLRLPMNFVLEDVECGECMGSRLRDDAAAVQFAGKTMDQLGRMPLGKLNAFFASWNPNVTEKRIAGDILTEVQNRLRFLNDVGLNYLTLSRGAPTLSGGESQRIRLAAQIGSGLVGVLYVLDEPTIGLHPRDNFRLIGAMQKLRDLGNTLLVVEHDRDVIAAADQILDFGPHSGKFGGDIVAQGTTDSISRNKNSVTGHYLSGKKAIPVPVNRRITAEEAANCPIRNAPKKH
ncbi:MAG: excinuclease ABC subunit UvrA [Thermoguttaceae bacterium]